MLNQYEHLARALLGLGASHLSENCDDDYTSQALQHRVIAIKLVNEQLNSPPKKPADADALLASIICLLSQSSLMHDSMIEYLTMTRGANLVATIHPDMNKSMFGPLSLETHVAALTSLVSEQPKDLALIEEAIVSVEQMRELCEVPYEVTYLESLAKVANALKTSSLDCKSHQTANFLNTNSPRLERIRHTVPFAIHVLK